MLFLSENYHLMSLNDFVNASKKRQKIPSKTAVITFDDGWEDNYLYAFPVLKKYKLPATIFLTTGFIGTDRAYWQENILFLTERLSSSQDILKNCFCLNNLSGFDTLIEGLASGTNINALRLALISRLTQVDEGAVTGLIDSLKAAAGNPEFPSRENAHLTWQQVSEMKNAAINFGSHGVNHRLLDMCAEGLLREELRLSKQMLEDKLERPAVNFAYPNGNYTEHVIGLLSECGYVSGVTVKEGLNTSASDLYRLKRINICEGRFLNPRGQFSVERFATRLAGLL